MMLKPYQEKAHSFSIHYTIKSHLQGPGSPSAYGKIEVEVNFHYSYVGNRRDGTPRREWSSRTYYVTPSSLLRLLRWCDGKKAETYADGDDWRMTHELTYER
jgi:hypothetical protein